MKVSNTVKYCVLTPHNARQGKRDGEAVFVFLRQEREVTPPPCGWKSPEWNIRRRTYLRHPRGRSQEQTRRVEGEHWVLSASVGWGSRRRQVNQIVTRANRARAGSIRVSGLCHLLPKIGGYHNDHECTCSCTSLCQSMTYPGVTIEGTATCRRELKYGVCVCGCVCVFFFSLLDSCPLFSYQLEDPKLNVRSLSCPTEIHFYM